MKLCFSTLGCLEWTLDRVLERAVAYGYQGVDFRGCHGELDLWNCPAFRADGAITRRRFEDAGVRIPCLSSSARMFAPEAERPAMREELLRYVEMAAGIGAGFVRVFGGKLGSTTLDEAIPAAATFLLEAAEIGRQSGVDVLIETHDDWVRSDRLHAAFEAAGFPAGVGVIWDVHHPYRQGGESPETTGARIGSLVKYTHWKDSRGGEPCGDGFRYTLTLPGEGDLPLTALYGWLAGHGYSGWHTLEWERKWTPSLDPPEVAFPRFVAVMTAIDAQWRAQHE